MLQKQDFTRGNEIGHEFHTMPATSYNNLRRLIQQNGDRTLLVPVPKLQYLAVVDPAEIVFVDLHFRHVIEFAWQSFASQDRDSLFSPVDFRYCWYNRLAHEAMQLMPEAFATALEKQLVIEKNALPSNRAALLTFPAEQRRKAG